MNNQAGLNVGDSGSIGAVLDSHYIKRTQKVVAVNKSDLDTIIQFDLKSGISTGLGIFLVSGASWLGGEKVLEQSNFQWTNITVLCATSIVFGVVCLVDGLWSHYKKRERILNIFNETEEVE